MMKQLCVTPSMGKRLIGKAMVHHPEIKKVLEKGTLVITAGTTNGYVAEELLNSLGQSEGFTRKGFYRGVTRAPGYKASKVDFQPEVVIRDGKWLKGMALEDVAGDLKGGDLVLKGANAFDPKGHAAVQVGNPKGGTILSVLPGVIGRRVGVIVPVGLEKRVFEDVHELAELCNAPGAEGTRLMPLPGKIFTEVDAIRLMTGAEAILIAAGGFCGAEGAAWLGITGTEEQIEAGVELIRSVAGEPLCDA